MKNWIIFLACHCLVYLSFAQDWEGIEITPSPGAGKVWELQEAVSDDFNYDFAPTSTVATFGDKWTNFYHNAWTGPAPTIWKRDHVSVSGGFLQIKTTRPEGQTVTVNSQALPVTNTGCVTSTRRIQYPVYIESRVKIMKSVLASDVWLLSPDDTQEIDICEAYGSSRWTNPWFSDKRIHLSHHVFIRSPFTDWQPSDEGSFYTDGSTVWSDNYHRIGVYWKDPWNLEYYVDGQLVRTRSGKAQIDPVYHTNAVNPGDTSNDTRTGLSKEMDIIINVEDQTWRALQGLSPTDAELAIPEDHIFKVDWIRVYKPVAGEVSPVTGVSLDQTEVNSFIGASFTLQASVEPNNANDISVVWESDNPTVATVNQEGLVECKADGVATITVTTNENQKTATCKVTVSGEAQPASIDFDDDSKYLNTDFQVGDVLEVSCNFHAGSGNTVVDGGTGGVKFWLREIRPSWAVANDYVVSDSSTIGQESGVATGRISLEGVPTTAEIPAENWYFLFLYFKTSDGKTIDKGIWPINIVNSTSIDDPKNNLRLKIYPNPSSSTIHIQDIPPLPNYFIEVLSPDGKMTNIPYKPIHQGSLTLDIEHLPKGVYLLRLIGDKVYTAPFVKQ